MASPPHPSHAARSVPEGEGHDHAHVHAHGHHGSAGGTLGLALTLTACYAVVEVVGGLLANSLALISDAGHMAADAGALLIALVAARLSTRPATSRNSYGYGRAEVIGAFINALTMLAVVVWIVVEAVNRVFKPLPMAGAPVMVVAAIGLGVNLAVLWLLTHGGAHAGHAHGDLNTHAAAVHVLGDLLGSVAAIVAGAVVQFTGWMPIDPLLSVLVALLILRSTWQVLGQSTGVLMEAVPEGVDLGKVGRALAAIPSVVSVHDLHIWQMSASRRALSAHLLIDAMSAWPRVLATARAQLRERHGINHVTLQPEWLAGHPGAKVIALKVEQVPTSGHGHHGHDHDHHHDHDQAPGHHRH
jgi:cobalt-zinc-cadmium efflux system protein